jgi:2-dehydropantoate 2-reductase
MRIDGAVIQPVVLDRRALHQLPRDYHVEDVGTLLPGTAGRAVTLQGLLELPALAVDADHVRIHSRDGCYAVTITLEQARQYGLLLYEQGGEALPDAKGGPFRFVAPGLGDLCAHVKAVGRIEVRVGHEDRGSARPSMRGADG